MKRSHLVHQLFADRLGGLFCTALTILFLINGCAVGPDYTKPAYLEEDLTDWEKIADAENITSAAADIADWWKYFEDPQLDQLINQALANNQDLEQARSRIKEARAQRGIISAQGLPSVTATGTAASVKTGELPAAELYNSGFDAAWELDIFGRVKRSVEAADASLEATIAGMHAVQVSLLAEVALNYIDARSFQHRLMLAEKNVNLQKETYRLVKSRYELGLAGGLELKEAEGNVANTESRIPPLKIGLDRAMHRLAVLIGKRPGTLNTFLKSPGNIPTAMPEIAIGLPADLMRRRPDIRRVERELAAQTARIGVAKADLYPRFTLSGVLSFQSTDASNLYTTLARTLSIGPSFRWNISSAGSVRNNINVQNEQQKQALLQYEKTILTALEEVENAIVAYARELDRNRSLQQAVTASQGAVRLAKSMYNDGLTDFIHVLDAQRNLFAQQDQLADSNAEITKNLIRLYKALGGGWRGAEKNRGSAGR